MFYLDVIDSGNRAVGFGKLNQNPDSRCCRDRVFVLGSGRLVVAWVILGFL